MRRKAAAAAMAFLLCFTLTGCDALQEMATDMLLEGLDQMLSDVTQDISTPGTDSSSTSPSSDASEPEPAPSQDTPEPPNPETMTVEEMMQSETLIYYNGIAQLAGGTNGDVKSLMGTAMRCQSELAFGGTPVASYVGNENAVMAIWLESPGQEELMHIWSTAERADSYSLPEYNCFPDNFNVEKIYLGGNEAVLGFLFLGREVYSIDAFSRCLKQEPQVTRLPAQTGEGMEMGPTEDLDVYTYEVDGFTIQIALSTSGEFRYVEIF